MITTWDSRTNKKPKIICICIYEYQLFFIHVMYRYMDELSNSLKKLFIQGKTKKNSPSKSPSGKNKTRSNSNSSSAWICKGIGYSI